MSENSIVTNQIVEGFDERWMNPHRLAKPHESGFLEGKIEAHDAFLSWIHAVRCEVLEDMSEEAIKNELHALFISGESSCKTVTSASLFL